MIGIRRNHHRSSYNPHGPFPLEYIAIVSTWFGTHCFDRDCGSTASATESLEDRLLDLAVKSADHREVQVNPDPSPGGESAKTTHRFEGPPIFPAVGPKPEAGFREQGLLSIALLLLVFLLAVVVAVKILQSRTSKKQETVEGAPSPRQLAQRQLAELRLRRHGIGESLHSGRV